MSYKEAMRWNKKHPKGTHQTVIMSTGSGFWPAGAWLEGNYYPYLEACQAANVEPLKAEQFYYATIGTAHFQRAPSDYAAMTKAGTLKQGDTKPSTPC